VAGHVEAGALTKEAPPGLGYGEPADTLPVSPPVRRRRVPVWVFGIVGVVLLAGLIGAALALRVFSPREPEPTPIAGGVPVEVTSTRAPAASAPTTAPHPAEAEAQAPTDIPAPTGTPSPIVKGEVLQECAQGLCVCDYDQGDCVPLGLGETYTSWWGYSWSPDGTQVVFAACLLEDFLSDPSVECCPNLYITNRDGSEVTALFPDPSHFYQFPAWSPDGEWVAFQRNCGLALIRSDGTELSLLTMSNKATCPEAIAWSPDGQRIAWLVIHDEPQAAEFAKVWVVGRDGSGIQEIFHVDNLDVRHDSQNRIAWGPDGQSVAFRLAGSSAYLLDVDCYDLPDGCDAMAPVSPYTFPEDWGHAFYPQWGGLRVP
jgi:dipeptidyl aminopeptidase/acylaminoacyl peptidase